MKYICEVCGKSYTKEEEALACENKHEEARAKQELFELNRSKKWNDIVKAKVKYAISINEYSDNISYEVKKNILEGKTMGKQEELKQDEERDKKRKELTNLKNRYTTLLDEFFKEFYPDKKVDNYDGYICGVTLDDLLRLIS